MIRTPFHKQRDPNKQAGQIVNGTRDIHDSVWHSPAALYKPVHGGYPDATPDLTTMMFGPQEGRKA